MTESEWATCTDPEVMLSFLRDRAPVDARKIRLFTCACARRVWRHLTDDRFRQLVETAERYADGLATEAERARAREAGWEAGQERWRDGSAEASSRMTWVTRHAYAAASVALQDDRDIGLRATDCAPDAVCAERLEYCMKQGIDQLPGDGSLVLFQRLLAPYCSPLRCIIGNPFTSVIFDPSWRTDTAVILARQMYESRDFGAMPILADALQDAGCEDEQILSHCRGDGPHVRGCWVVDLVLGKE